MPRESTIEGVYQSFVTVTYLAELQLKAFYNILLQLQKGTAFHSIQSEIFKGCTFCFKSENPQDFISF